MKAITTGWPLYWLRGRVFPPGRLMEKSGALRGNWAAGRSAANSNTAGVIHREVAIRSVYRRFQTFHAGDDGAFAAQLEAAIVACSGDGVAVFRRHGHALPLLVHDFPVRREIPAGAFFAVPFGGVK